MTRRELFKKIGLLAGAVAVGSKVFPQDEFPENVIRPFYSLEELNAACDYLVAIKHPYVVVLHFTDQECRRMNQWMKCLGSSGVYQAKDEQGRGFDILTYSRFHFRIYNTDRLPAPNGRYHVTKLA